MSFRLRGALALSLLFACAPLRAPAQQAAPSAALHGLVVDGATSLPLAGATVVVTGRPDRAVTGNDGRFAFPSLPPGLYRLRVERGGYQPTQSDDVALVGGAVASVTLAVQRELAAGTLRTIGATSTNAATSLLRATTTTVTVTTDALRQRGMQRAADALRELPGISNGIVGDTAALADDVPLQLRGIGTLETTTAIDEHPIAYGFPGGYNFQVSPLAPFRDLSVTYGSGSNLLGTSAIGGVVDLRTLQPTPDARVNLDLGYGSFGRSAANVTATGTAGRLGYAFAYGSSGLDGPIRHAHTYQPAAAFDVTATDPAVHAIGVYDADASADSHAALAKLQYDLTPTDRIVATGVFDGYYENKSGNGDGDYLDGAPALAFAQRLVGKGSTCGAGLVQVSNAAGGPGGAGPGGTPDGGAQCVTAQQYAAATSGWQGNGPAFQTFDLADYQLAYEHTRADSLARVVVFADRYDDFVSRQFRLPFVASPGDSFSVSENDEREGGALATFDRSWRNNTAGIGYTFVNTSFALARDTSKASSFSAPVAHQQTYTLRDVYRAGGSPLSLFGNLALTQASATQRYALDPRLTVLDSLTAHDVVRVSAGATTTQPAGNQLAHPFVPQTLGSAGGGGGVKCGALNAIGSVPSSALRPERGVDEEVAYAHGFGGDAFAQVALYDVRVYDKLYSALTPLATTGSSFIPPAFLAQQLAAIANACGSTDPATLAGLNGTFNIGQMRARGFTLSGRHRLDRQTAFDYAWTLDSTALVAVPVTYLQSNLNVVPGSQLPGLPLHTLDASLDRVVGNGIDVRYTFHWVSDNNTKRLPAYDYSALRVSAPLAHATVSLAVDNLFGQHAEIRGLLYEGEPYALNAYATPAAYAPYTGAAASERFGLPYRSVYLDASFRVR